VTVLFYALPAAALLVALLLGRYPGERLIIVAAERTRCRPWRAARSASRCAPLDSTPTPRGGDLLGRALAGRAPPDARWRSQFAALRG
jgi:hypothetical protein